VRGFEGTAEHHMAHLFQMGATVLPELAHRWAAVATHAHRAAGQAAGMRLGRGVLSGAMATRRKAGGAAAVGLFAALVCERGPASHDADGASGAEQDFGSAPLCRRRAPVPTRPGVIRPAGDGRARRRPGRVRRPSPRHRGRRGRHALHTVDATSLRLSVTPLPGAPSTCSRCRRSAGRGAPRHQPRGALRGGTTRAAVRPRCEVEVATEPWRWRRAATSSWS
jgi:hypothetical protein